MLETITTKNLFKSTRSRLRPSGFALIVAIIFVFAAGSGAQANFVSQVNLGAIKELPATARVTGRDELVTLTANDIAADHDGVIWLAAEEGLFAKRGLAWEHVETARISRYADGFTGARRITFGADGRMWVVDSKGELYARRNDGSWLRIIDNVADIAAEKSKFYVLFDRSEAARAEGFVDKIFLGEMTDLIHLEKGLSPEEAAELEANIAAGAARRPEAPFSGRFVTFPSTRLGEPQALTVDHYGRLLISTNVGNIMFWDDDQLYPLGLECDLTDWADACKDRGWIEDLAYSNGAVWLTGADAKGGFTRHYTEGRFSDIDNAFPQLAPQMSRVGANQAGDLLGITKDGAPVMATLSYDHLKSIDPFTLGLRGISDHPKLEFMARFDAAGPTIKERIGKKNGIDYMAEMNPETGLTVSFAMAPAEGAKGTQCALAIGSSSKQRFSVCFNADHTEMTVKIGGDSQTFPVNTKIGDFMESQVGRMFVISIDGVIATVKSVQYTLDRRKVADGIQTEAEDIGEMILTNPQWKSGGANLYIGSRNGRKDRFHGYLSSVRIWRTAVDPEWVFMHRQIVEVSDHTFPKAADLLIDVPLASQDIKGAKATEVLFRATPNIVGDWFIGDQGEAYDVEIAIEPNGPGTFGIRKIETLSIRELPLEDPFSAQRLEIIRNGEDGSIRTTWEQSAAGVYLGWQDPRSREIYLAPSKAPYELRILGANTLLVQPPYNDKWDEEEPEGYTLSPAPDDQEYDLPDNPIGAESENFIGYDVTIMSPYLSRSRGGASDAEGRTDGRLGRVFEKTSGTGSEADLVLPKGLVFADISEGSGGQTTRVVKNSLSLTEDLRFKIGAGMEVPEIMAFSRSVEMEQSVKNMQSSSSMMAIGELWYAYYALIHDPLNMPLSEGFREQITLAAKGELPVRQIIKAFGTHYANAVVYGASARYEKALDEKEIENAVKKRWAVAMENEGTIKGVKLNLDAELGMGSEREFEQFFSEETTRVSTHGTAVSFALEEVIVGDNPQRAVPIATDLRPITQLLNPVYFDDPDIYERFRAELEVAIAEHVAGPVPKFSVSATDLTPTIYELTLDKLIIAELGAEGVTGSVTARYRKPGATDWGKEHLIWRSDGTGPAKPLEGQEIVMAKSIPIRAVAGGGASDGEIQLAVEYASVATGERLTRTTRTIGLFGAGVRDLPSTHVLSVLGESCQCVTACPEGFVDDDGVCASKCPAGFDERGRTCHGSYKTTYYFPGFKKRCDAAHLSTGGCEWVGLEIYPKCKENYFRSAAGWCVPECEAFDLDKAPLSVTCKRRTSERTATPRTEDNQCRPGSTPNVDCGRVEGHFTLRPLPLGGILAN